MLRKFLGSVQLYEVDILLHIDKTVLGEILQWIVKVNISTKNICA